MIFCEVCESGGAFRGKDGHYYCAEHVDDANRRYDASKCPTCADFAVLAALAKNMEHDAPGLSRAINAFLITHLSVMHGWTYQDLAAVGAEAVPVVELG